MKQVEQKSLFIDKMGVLYFIRGKWFSNPYVIIFVYLWIYRTLWNINFNKHTKTSAIFRNSNEIEQMIMHTWPRMIVMASYSSILERKIFSMNDVSTHCWKNYFEIYFNNWRRVLDCWRKLKRSLLSQNLWNAAVYSVSLQSVRIIHQKWRRRNALYNWVKWPRKNSREWFSCSFMSLLHAPAPAELWSDYAAVLKMKAKLSFDSICWIFDQNVECRVNYFRIVVFIIRT